jgi:hypothetical protein
VILGIPDVSTVTRTETSKRSGGVPRPARTEPNAMAKHPACAAAISSSGLVLPSGRTESRCECDREASDGAATSGGHAHAARSSRSRRPRRFSRREPSGAPSPRRAFTISRLVHQGAGVATASAHHPFWLAGISYPRRRRAQRDRASSFHDTERDGPRGRPPRARLRPASRGGPRARSPHARPGSRGG